MYSSNTPQSRSCRRSGICAALCHPCWRTPGQTRPRGSATRSSTRTGSRAAAACPTKPSPIGTGAGGAWAPAPSRKVSRSPSRIQSLTAEHGTSRLAAALTRPKASSSGSVRGGGAGGSGRARRSGRGPGKATRWPDACAPSAAAVSKAAAPEAAATAALPRRRSPTKSRTATSRSGRRRIARRPLGSPRDRSPPAPPPGPARSPSGLAPLVVRQLRKSSRAMIERWIWPVPS